MGTQRRILISFVTILVLSSTACASTTTSLAERFAKYKDCPREQVSVHQLGGNLYAVDGCGKHVEYVCSSFVEPSNAPGRGCVEQGTGPARGPVVSPPPPAEFDPPN